jgi:hypothetical protein
VREAGKQWLLAPLRPSRKSAEPLVPFAEYIDRRRPDGLPADPWLRTHVDAGAEITNICHHSVSVKASLSKWRDWTGRELDDSGTHHIDGALMPLKIDSGFGIYSEPNVWVKYRL